MAEELPLFVRLSMTDWVEGGWDAPEAVELCRLLAARGDVDLIDCTSGGVDPAQRIPLSRLSGAICRGGPARRRHPERRSRIDLVARNGRGDPPMGAPTWS